MKRIQQAGKCRIFFVLPRSRDIFSAHLTKKRTKLRTDSARFRPTVTEKHIRFPPLRGLV
jgi:hypothetical protein